jgi:hypothetical protein
MTEFFGGPIGLADGGAERKQSAVKQIGAPNSDEPLGNCERFQRVASAWLRSGEITRTNHLLSPLEELAGFNYGFVYLLDLGNPSALPMGARSVSGAPSDYSGTQFHTVKLGYSEHPMRRIRELRAGFRYGRQLRLRACFVGEPDDERALHLRFAHLRVEHERFLASPAIDAEFTRARTRIYEELRSLHCCSAGCPQVVPRLDLRMLSTWLRR